jgi:hypothetical protein
MRPTHIIKQENTMRTLVAMIGLILVMMGSANAAPSGQLHAFYGEHPVTTQADFILRLDSPALTVDRGALVNLFDQEFGQRIGPVSGFEDLIQKLASNDYEVLQCSGQVVNYGQTDAGTLATISRPCYAGEFTLVHRATGIAVFSLYCGNLRKPPPPAGCMEITVHLIGGSSKPTMPLVRYWGGHAVADCGLLIVDCECVTSIPPAATFHAPAITGSVGIIRIPRAMLANLNELCIEISGYHNPGGTRDKLIRGEWARRASEHAISGSLFVLRETEFLEFRSDS